MSNVLNKNNCIKTSNEKNEQVLHPLLNTTIENKLNECCVIPQMDNNLMKFTMKKDTLKSDKIDNSLLFTIPICRSNFIDIVFNISTLNQLNEWLNTYKTHNIETINLVLNLFWENYYSLVNEEFELFKNINEKIIKNILNKNISNNNLNEIVNIFIKNNYGKNIIYLDKIKKYLMKYI